MLFVRRSELAKKDRVQRKEACIFLLLNLCARLELPNRLRQRRFNRRKVENYNTSSICLVAQMLESNSNSFLL